ncbi:MAG: flagellar hook-associated protein FlgK [Candidatus Saccharibacteria bacterium]
MLSTFMNLELGRRAVMAQQYALDVTGHNVANASTAGYTRQEAIMKTTTPFCSPTMTDISVGQFGTGVVMDEIRRMRDEFMDLQFRSENKTSGLWDSKKDVLDKLEGIVNEPTDNSLRSSFDAFWKALQTLSENPETDSVRATVFENANSLVDTFHHVFKQLEELREDLNGSIKIKVDEVNNLAQQIADINGQIQAVVIGGKQPNDLLDARDKLIDDLSKIVDVNIMADRNQMKLVMLGGRAIVEGINTHPITVNADEKGMYKVVWGDNTDIEVAVSSGSLYGLMEGRGINKLYWDTIQTNITKVENYFEDDILNYRVDTQMADNNLAAVPASVSKLYEYSAFSGDLIPSAGLTYNLNGRNDLNGQVMLEVISKDAANNLTIRYTTDIIDRTGTRKQNTSQITVAAWAPGGDMHMPTLDIDGLGDTLHLDLTGLARASSDFNTGDKFVMGFTATRATGANANDGLTLFNTDITPTFKENQFQYWFNDGVMQSRNMVLGSFALNETTGEILRNDSFRITFGSNLKDGTAQLINLTSKTNRELFAQDIVDPYAGLVPTLLDKVNNLAKVVITEMNKVHKAGYNLKKFPDNTNVAFFKDFGDDVATDFNWADKIDISDEVKSDLNYIAAASKPTRDSYGNRINYGDGGNAITLAGLKQKALDSLSGSSIDDYWRSAVADLGVVSQQATRMQSNQDTLVKSIITKREEVSGVSLDEEMTNMIKFQHAYSAAARFINIIDECIDLVVNRLGTVGR